MAVPAFYSYLSSPFKRNFWHSIWDSFKYFVIQPTGMWDTIGFKPTILTGPRNFIFGLLPTLSTILVLLVTAAALAAFPWAIAASWGAVSTAMSSSSIYCLSFASVLFYAAIGYYFEGPATRKDYKATPVFPGTLYGHEQPVELHKLVRHAHHLVLAGEYFQAKPIEEKKALLKRKAAYIVDNKNLPEYYPFSLNVTKGQMAKHVIRGLGRSEMCGHINFSSGCFSLELKLTPAERAALVMMEVINIRQRNTLRNTFYGMTQQILKIIDSFNETFKIFFFITNFIRLLGKASERAAYRETLIEITRAGMGKPLKSGLKKVACPSLAGRVPATRDYRKNFVGGHWYDFIEKPLYNYVRNNEGDEYKQHWFLSLIDLLFMNVGYFFSRLEANELNSEEIGKIISETIENEALENFRFSLTGRVEKKSEMGGVDYCDVAYSEVQTSIETSFTVGRPDNATVSNSVQAAPTLIFNANSVEIGQEEGNSAVNAPVASRTRSHTHGNRA